MRITSESPESGDGFDEVPVDYAGAEVVIGAQKMFLKTGWMPSSSACGNVVVRSAHSRTLSALVKEENNE